MCGNTHYVRFRVPMNSFCGLGKTAQIYEGGK